MSQAKDQFFAKEEGVIAVYDLDCTYLLVQVEPNFGYILSTLRFKVSPRGVDAWAKGGSNSSLITTGHFMIPPRTLLCAVLGIGTLKFHPNPSHTISSLSASFVFTDNAAYEFNYELSKNSTYAIMAIPHCIPMCPFICCYVNSSIFMDNVNDKIRAQVRREPVSREATRNWGSSFLVTCGARTPVRNAFATNYGTILKPSIQPHIRLVLLSSQHVALTRDGIKYVTEMHKTGCRLDCQDQGKLSKTVPYDKITDCDIEEPAGSSGPCCCMVKNVLTVVNVDTASGARGGSEGGARGHELSIQGLVDPHKVRRVVYLGNNHFACDTWSVVTCQ